MTDSANANSVNQVWTALHTMAQSNSSERHHSENTRTHLKLDEQAVQDINSCITEFECDPSDANNPSLRTLQSGVLASTVLLDDFESAHKAGEDLFKRLCNDSMLSNNVFYSTVCRSAWWNFNKPPPTTGDYCDNVAKSVAMENRTLASVTALAEAHL